MAKVIGIYLRVSSKRQDTASQEADVERWATAQGQPVRYYRDTFTGKTMDRPGWQALEADMRAGLISTVVVWRLDRIGRTASGLTKLFDELRERKINLVSLREGVDLRTATGRLMATIIAGLAEWENEIRSERIVAGQEAARAKGKTWGGCKPGVRRKVTHEREKAILGMYEQGTPITQIAKLLKISRPTIYGVLDRACQPS